MSTTVDPALLSRVAKNARLDLSEDEKKAFLPQLKGVFAVFDELKQLDVDGVEPAFHPVLLENVFREDVVKKGFDNETALSQSPHKKDSFFRGPRVVE